MPEITSPPLVSDLKATPWSGTLPELHGTALAVCSRADIPVYRVDVIDAARRAKNGSSLVARAQLIMKARQLLRTALPSRSGAA